MHVLESSGECIIRHRERLQLLQSVCPLWSTFLRCQPCLFGKLRLVLAGAKTPTSVHPRSSRQLATERNHSPSDRLSVECYRHNAASGNTAGGLHWWASSSPRSGREWLDQPGRLCSRSPGKIRQRGSRRCQRTRPTAVQSIGRRLFPLWREGTTLQFRADFLNAFNNVNFQALNVNRSNSDFGTISSAYPPRNIQFSLRLQF